MAPKRSHEKKSSSTSVQADTTKSRAEWKTGDQLEWLLSQWSGFLRHQNEKTLDRFWPPVYHAWSIRWPITPTPESVAQHGSKENAILVLRSETNAKIRMWFHNHARPSTKTGKSDLRLTQSDKRKVAPVQAYCSYAWDKGLREIVIKRWEEQKLSHMSTDDDDPTADVIEAPESGSHIPINFKIKIAKEQYNLLSQVQKKAIDDRREEEREKMYRSIPEIKDVEERDKKLLVHQRNQPSIASSLLRVLRNLEDQAGGIAHLLVGHVNPATGESSFQRFCQGRTKEGLDFHDFCGDDWENVIEKRFSEWGVAIFGDLHSEGRSTFMFSNLSPGDEEATPSTSRPNGSVTTVTDPTETSPGIDSIVVCEGGRVGEPSTSSTSQDSKTTQAIPSQALVPLSVVSQPQFVVPQDIFPPPQPIAHADDRHTTILPTTAGPPTITPSSSQSVGHNHVVISPILQESSPLATPLAPEPAAAAPDQITIPTIARDPVSLVTPLESTTLISNQHAVSIIPYKPVSLVAPILDISHINQTIISSTVHPDHSLGTPSSIPEFSQTLAPNQALVVQRPTPYHQATGPTLKKHSPGLAEGVTRDSSVAANGAYRLRGTASTTTAAKTRRDSIDGAPDIMLSLGPSGYEVVEPPSQQETRIASVESDMDIPASPPVTPSPVTPSESSIEELVIPSSQQTIEECLVIPVGAETVIPTMSPADNPMATSPQRHVEDPLTTTAVPKTTNVLRNFYLALREIPTYSIDRSDLPSWIHERGRLDFVLSVEGGEVWKRLITAWLEQERRAGFGLNEHLGASLSLKDKPSILGDYFKWHHTPSKGDSVVLPGFGDEVQTWWSGIQPEWRYKNELSPESQNDYSYILAGGKKGVFLLILCLAWWDKAYGRDMEREKTRRREVARVGMDKTPPDFNDLLDHDTKWFNIVNDLLFVMEIARAWPVPEGTSAGAAPARKKRAAEGGDRSSTRKKVKAS